MFLFFLTQSLGFQQGALAIRVYLQYLPKFPFIAGQKNCLVVGENPFVALNLDWMVFRLWQSALLKCRKLINQDKGSCLLVGTLINFSLLFAALLEGHWAGEKNSMICFGSNSTSFLELSKYTNRKLWAFFKMASKRLTLMRTTGFSKRQLLVRA